MKILLVPYTSKRIDGKPNAKDYPYWKELVNLLSAQNELFQYVMPGDVELVPGIIKHMPFSGFHEMVKGMDTFICIDSYLPHFMNCHFPEKRGIVLFGPSDPAIWGYKQNLNLSNGKQFIRPNQFETWMQWEANPNAHVEPMDVVMALSKLKRSLMVTE